jgi:hypothetical protein
MAYVFAIGMLGIFWVVIYKIATDRIDLGTLMIDHDSGSGAGKTSMSRFQLLVFTLTIALLYAILCIESGQLLEVPNGTLSLLGISGGSFLLSKGIGSSAAAKRKAASGSDAKDSTKD